MAHPKAKEIKFHLPFISNLKGQSPIHICIANSAFKPVDSFL